MFKTQLLGNSTINGGKKMSENAQKAEITYQAIFALLKKSFVRMVIFALVAAVIAGGVGALFILLTREDSSFQAMVEYNYDGAEDGLDPWGMKLDVTKIKSDSIVTQALIDNNYSEEERAELKSQVINNITLAGVVPEDIMDQILIIKEIATTNPTQLNELNEISYISTSYLVTLKNDAEMGLTSTECVNILNSIIDNYLIYFKESYGFNDALGTLIGGEVSTNGYDFIEINELYTDQITNILDYLDLMISKSNSFRSTTSKMSFEDMRARIVSISSYDLSKLELYIYENGVSNGNSAINTKTYIEEKIVVTDRAIAATTALIAATNTAIANYVFAYNTTTTEANTTIQVLANGEGYEELQSNLITYQSTLVSQNSAKTLWTERLAKINTASMLTDEEKAAAIAQANTMVSKIETSLTQEIAYINDAVDEYIANEEMKNSINKTLSATMVAVDTTNYKVLLVVLALVIFIACLVAIGVTYKKNVKITEVVLAGEKA